MSTAIRIAISVRSHHLPISVFFILLTLAVVKQSGAYGGSANGTYYCAYKYFEKRRIAEGKKKTPKRLRMEKEESGGVDTTRRSGVWTYVGK